MKNIKGICLLLLLAVAFLAACSKDEAAQGGGNGNPLGTVAYEIDRIENFTAVELAAMTFASGDAMGGGADILSVFSGSIAAREQQLQKELGVEKVELGYRKINYLYSSVDHLGNPVTLSSALYWNCYKVGAEWYYIAPERICLTEHYTITSDAESPTAGFPVEPLLLGNSLVVMPDYLGYGYTADQLHPYLNHNVAAVNSIDALDAAYAVCRDYAPTLLSGEWTMCVLGASQGGSNALAVHKYLDTHSQLAEKWNFTHSNCAAGAYSPALTFTTYMQWEQIEYPVVFPLVLKSMIASNPDIMGGWSEEDFYSERYLEIKPRIDAMLAGKKHTTNEINALFFEHFATGGAPALVSVRDILSAAALSAESEMREALFRCFDRYDLTRGWTPKHPVRLYHSRADRVVPFENALEAVSSFGTNATLQAVEGEGHVGSCTMWLFSLFLAGA